MGNGNTLGTVRGCGTDAGIGRPEASRSGIWRWDWVGLLILLILVCAAGCDSSQSAKDDSQSAKDDSQSAKDDSQSAKDDAWSARDGIAVRQHQVVSKPKPAKDAPKLAIRVLDSKRYDSWIKTQLTTDALVSGELTDAGLRDALDTLFKRAQATRGWRYHSGRVTHVYICLYTSEAHYNSKLSLPPWIAMLQKLQVGDHFEKSVTIRDGMLAQIGKPQEVKFGLTGEKRGEIYRLLCVADDRSDAKAQQDYPVGIPRTDAERKSYGERLGKQIDLANSLYKEYEGRICKKFGITKDQLRDVLMEGTSHLVYKSPMPPAP